MIDFVFKRFVLLFVSIVFVVLIGCGGASKVSQKGPGVPLKAVDATTEATKWNQHEGTEASLTDGKYLTNDKEAKAFVLKEKGKGQTEIYRHPPVVQFQAALAAG